MSSISREIEDLLLASWKPFLKSIGIQSDNCVTCRQVDHAGAAHVIN